MPYYKNNLVNLLFIHIPKTGGSSLELYFSKKYKIRLNNKSLYLCLNKNIKIENNIRINTTLQHMTYQTICKYNYFFNIKFNNLKIISIVRNPYERSISDLFFLKKITINTTPDEIFEILQKYILATNLDNHNIPQYMFITNENKELLNNIHILHTENLVSDMHQLGYTDFNMYENVNSVKINYYNYLNDKSIKLINEFYDYDFTLFNYVKINC
jgi:hypothetical protein